MGKARSLGDTLDVVGRPPLLGWFETSGDQCVYLNMYESRVLLSECQSEIAIGLFYAYIKSVSNSLLASQSRH